MTERKVEYGKNIDVFILSDGRKGTILDYIDIKIADGLAVRVCHVQDVKTGEKFLYLDKQLVAAFEKHESNNINTYGVIWFFGENNKGTEERIIGDGNLIHKVFEICSELKIEEKNRYKVMIMIEKQTGITV
jgi:hypothetical protein